MTPTTVWRPAGPGDALALRDLERTANLAALGHVFPVDRFPFPDAEVLAHWESLLSGGNVHVDVVDGSAGLDVFVAWDAEMLRHLAVRPDRWGNGLAGAAVARAVDAITSGGGRARLWCLHENHRARRLYEHLGWTPTGRERAARFAPYPSELEYAAPVGVAS